MIMTKPWWRHYDNEECGCRLVVLFRWVTTRRKTYKLDIIEKQLHRCMFCNDPHPELQAVPEPHWRLNVEDSEPLLPWEDLTSEHKVVRLKEEGGHPARTNASERVTEHNSRLLKGDHDAVST